MYKVLTILDMALSSQSADLDLAASRLALPQLSASSALFAVYGNLQRQKQTTRRTRCHRPAGCATRVKRQATSKKVNKTLDHLIIF